MKKMNRRFLTTVVAALFALFLGGCLKGYDGKVVYVLKPLVSEGSENENIDRYVTAYAIYADTTRWTVGSYDDALSMRITDKESGETFGGEPVVAEPFVEDIGGGRYAVEMSLRPRTVMLVVVDTELKLYGYREQKLSEGLTSIFETVIFYTTRNASRYKAGQWMMCNDFYAPPAPEPDENEDNE